MSRQKRPDSQVRLLDFWERKEEFGRPVGCVATTYTFDASFFEEECLTRFAGIDSDPAEDRVAYFVEREEKLADVFACALVDRGHVAPQRSLRWHLLPVRVPGGGVQHAKVSLLVWERRVRLLVGSCNLTIPGYRQNFENLCSLDFTAEGEVPLIVLSDAVGFLETVQQMAPGSVTVAGPQRALRAFLELVRAQVARWPRGEWTRGEPSARFTPVLPGGPTLFSQVAGVWEGTGPSLAWVLSPFFDQGENCRPTVAALEAIMGRNGERTVWFAGAGQKYPDGRVDLEMPAALAEPWLRRLTHRFSLVSARDTQENPRALHAKSLWLEREREYQCVYVAGSSNFTAAGTGVAGERGNVEANVAYLIPNVDAAFGRRCKEAYPPYTDLESADGIQFLQALTDETPDSEAFVALHPAFGAALYRPEGSEGVLELELLADAPSEFTVQPEGGEAVLDGRSWRAQGAPTKMNLVWARPRPPSGLQVDWTGGNPPERRRSWWVVNVTDTSRLPPPDELRDLPLALLLEILSSARPLHEVLTAASSRATMKGVTAELDPHKRVDTSQYLLKRVKRVSVALEGLRQRLERPAFSLDALRWRLDGPVGPVALARQIVTEEPRAAAFLIAEVVILLRRVDLSRLRDLLGEGVVSNEVERVADLVREMGSALPAPHAVKVYVKDVLAGASQ